MGFFDTIDWLLEMDIGKASALFVYRTPKYLVVDYWLVGALNRLMQIAIVTYVFWGIFAQNTWAYTAVPMGLVNAWSTGGTAADEVRGLADYTSPAHCSSAAHGFKYSATFDYGVPECRYVPHEQLVRKGRGQVSVTTMFLETEHRGWNSADGDNQTKWDACLAASGSPSLFATGQAVCQTRKTVYPLGVESMRLQFEHTYQLPDAKFDMDKWKGASGLTVASANSNAAVTAPLRTYIKAADGSLRAVGEGLPVTQTIAEWLATADDSSLDARNPYADVDKTAGAENPSHPFYRMTGMVVLVNVEYHNGEPSVDENRNVNAYVTATKQLVAWAGPGSDRIHVEYPSGPGGMSFRYVDRYAQGVVFDFEASGRVYKFNVQHFINALLLGFVMLKVAATVTDFVAFNLLPNGHSAMLKPHRAEKISKKQGFAELGIKACLAAQAYSIFDPDQNMKIEAADIVRILAAVVPKGETDEGGITAEKAHALALAVLGGTDKDSTFSLDFNEYMTTQDNGSIEFAQFLKLLKVPDGQKDPAVVAAVEEAFEKGRPVVQRDKKRSDGDALTNALSAASRKAQGLEGESSHKVSDQV